MRFIFGDLMTRAVYIIFVSDKKNKNNNDEVKLDEHSL